jgi:D-alanine-D-alanine ligase
MRVVAELGLPLIVKPAREGSTIGITKVAKVDHDEMSIAFDAAAKHDSLVLVEEFVSGSELTASIVSGRALPLIRIEAPGGNYEPPPIFLGRDEIFLSGQPARRQGAGDPEPCRCGRSASSAAAGAVSIILRADGTFSFLEVNTSPGMTPHSLVPMAAKQTGMSFPELCVEILRGAHVG